ncbi:caspase family protein [Mesorhizobium sp. CA18]|uniref:caspase family protein n=1 Tax=unclassified Mesorhizobium TaxID=325217 RepID=UPI001CCF7E2F|nr:MULTISPECIES: caspase family protein [unclassified Mesorhizobium]MBZ9735761.1 caspase family protein [Mesorhizobium sp. CA9]MBZ9827638.1 caspase family protein [Mesorhizobium sp. CA18]MBZ9833340.1 caspase family protein [Mesorhizobium sp. CA2]MBZ9839649.1 caspase family protein [Mesorhizobium sp. CA3]MBZ9879852.1 caspase family protein [Mesorhizobium sp. Ca11]
MRIFTNPQAGGSVRVLVLGAGHYPLAQLSKPKVPKLADIASAARSAVEFAAHILTDWRPMLGKPLASVDLLVNTAQDPDGVTFGVEGVGPVKVEAPTLDNIIAARTSWLDGAMASDTLIFYCCGHGIWLPSVAKTFLASDFGSDEDAPWPKAISLDAFAQGLGDKAPREQWLIFDCCANIPPEALRDANPTPNPLVSTTSGLRTAMIDVHGPLIQATIASASLGLEAYGRQDGRSRLMDVFVEACQDAGFRDQANDGRWWITLQSLENAMSTYRYRVAPPQDRDYYTFSRLTSSDAPDIPRLMVRDKPAACTLLVTSDPALRLKQCNLDIYQHETRVAGQAAGATAQERFRHIVEPFEKYRVDAQWPQQAVESRERMALPPLTEVNF